MPVPRSHPARATSCAPVHQVAVRPGRCARRRRFLLGSLLAMLAGPVLAHTQAAAMSVSLRVENSCTVDARAEAPPVRWTCIDRVAPMIEQRSVTMTPARGSTDHEGAGAVPALLTVVTW